MESPRFRHTDHGVEILDDWPPAMMVTRELLEQADPRYLVRHWRTVTFLPGHQVAVYRMVRCDRWTRTYLLRRL
jgi:hypothetical protein